MGKSKGKHNVAMWLVVMCAILLISASSAVAQTFGWRATATVPAGTNPDDFHALFGSTGGSVANVAWDAANATAAAPNAIGPNGAPGNANGVDITWAAAIAPGDVIAFTFSTDFPFIDVQGGDWTVGGVVVASIAPGDITLTKPGGPVSLMGIDVEDRDLQVNPDDHGSVGIWTTFMNSCLVSVRAAGNNNPNILVIGAGKNAADRVTLFWDAVNTNLNPILNEPIMMVNGAAAITAAPINAFAMIVVVSDEDNTLSGGLTQLEHDALSNRKIAIAQFINNGGGLIGFSSSKFVGQPNGPYAYIAGALGLNVNAGVEPFANVIITHAGGDLFGVAPGMPADNTGPLDTCCWHDVFPMPLPGFMLPLVLHDTIVQEGFGDATAIGGIAINLPIPAEPIPAVSNVGLVALLLLTAVAGVIVIRRARRGHAAG